MNFMFGDGILDQYSNIQLQICYFIHVVQNDVVKYDHLYWIFCDEPNVVLIIIR